MKKQTIPQKPAPEGMTGREVKAQWVKHHADKLKIKLYQEERHDRSRENEAVLYN